MALSPAVSYLQLIQTYFPPEQVANAACILAAETAAWANVCGADPASCVVDLGNFSCYPDQPVQPAKAYGLYKIVDLCWDPAKAGVHTPFTASDWAQILDPNTNVWAASVVWSIAGWRAWTTCSQCADCPSCVAATPPCALPCGGSLCDVPGGPIPYPRAPLSNPLAPAPSAPSPYLAFGVIGVLLAGLVTIELRGPR